MPAKQIDWNVSNRYNLSTDIFTLDGLNAVRLNVADNIDKVIRAIWIPITDITEPISKSITDLYKHKSDLDFEKEKLNYEFMQDNDELVFDAEKAKIIILLIAACFITVFILNA